MSELLSLDDKIDLVIPRGSYDLVRSIQEQTAGRIPVLGHSEGVCSVYVDRFADINKTLKIGLCLFIECCLLLLFTVVIVYCLLVVDSKCNYPSACNSMENLLIHRDIIGGELFQRLIAVLRDNQVPYHINASVLLLYVVVIIIIVIVVLLQVQFNPGPKLSKVLPYPQKGVASLHNEYGDLQCTVELVNNVQEAIDIINTYGSHHTDTIITEDGRRSGR